MLRRVPIPNPQKICEAVIWLPPLTFNLCVACADNTNLIENNNLQVIIRPFIFVCIFRLVTYFYHSTDLVWIKERKTWAHCHLVYWHLLRRACDAIHLHFTKLYCLIDPEGKYQALEKYGIDLTEQARRGKLDPVIGRDDEIRRCIQILCRRTKNNPVIIGEPGVGKTAIVEGYCYFFLVCNIDNYTMVPITTITVMHLF